MNSLDCNEIKIFINLKIIGEKISAKNYIIFKKFLKNYAI